MGNQSAATQHHPILFHSQSGGSKDGRSNVCVREEEMVADSDEDVKTKNLAKYLGMKDGISASIAAQVWNNN